MRGLFWRVFLSQVLVTGLALGLMTSLVSYEFHDFSLGLAKAQLDARTRTLAQALEPVIENPNLSKERLQRMVRYVGAVSDTNICLVLNSGPDRVVLGPKGSSRSLGPGASSASAGGTYYFTGASNPCNEGMLISNLDFPGGRGSLFVVAPASTAVDASVKMLRRLLLYAAIAGVGLALLVALALSRRISEPLARITGLAQRMAGGDFSQRLGIRGKDEIGDLAGSFDRMADSLEQLDEMRKRFLSDASHEIRTPLTAIGGFAAALADGAAATEEERGRAAAFIVRETERLSRLVNELLDLSRMESGAIELDLEETDLADLIQQTVEGFQKQARERGITIDLDLPADLPHLHVDADRIYQVMVNLVTNALRYNREQGHVTISAAHTDGEVRVTVRDTGIGIPAPELPNIWERFHRADAARARVDGGTGLGLAIVRSIIQKHGGTVSAESEVGVGSAFCVSLPVQ